MKVLSQSKKAPKVKAPTRRTGLLGDATDYNYYNLSLGEKVCGFLLGGLACFVGSLIIFRSPIFSMIAAVAVGCVYQRIYARSLAKKRQRELLLQFKDLLESLSNSYAVGKNTSGAFADAHVDLSRQYGEKAYIVREVATVIIGTQNSFSVEDMLEDFGERSGLEDVKSFANTFKLSNRLGGNLREIVSECRDIIGDKIDIEIEINTMVAEKKNELYLLVLMPFLVIGAMSFLGNDSLVENSFVNVVVRAVALVIFFIAFRMGQKITDIKI